MTTEKQEQSTWWGWLVGKPSGIITGILVCLLVILFGSFVLVMVSDRVKEFVSCLLGLTEKSGILTFLGIGMGGILLALRAVASYRRAKAMEGAAYAQARATNATEQGQRQERLKNAIEHLGHESVSVRLGGAYELFHLAEDTEKLRRTAHKNNDDQSRGMAEDTQNLNKTALDILCAHIRRTTGEGEYRKTYKEKPSEEVQSLLNLLFVQEHQVFNGLHANLQGSFLNGANLRGAHLQGAFLLRAHLKMADLFAAKMQGADLRDAHLQCAFLNCARLQGADLGGSKMQGTRLVEAQLQGAGLGGTGLQGAILTRAQLQGASSLDRDYSLTFAELMRKFVDQETDLTFVFCEGGLRQEDVDSFVQDLPDPKASSLRSVLERHIRVLVEASLENRGVVTGTYTQEEAEPWIAEYEQAMSTVPSESNT